MSQLSLFEDNLVKKLKKRVVDISKIISQLERSALSAKTRAESINTDVSGNWTYRRQSFADNNRKKQVRLLKWSNALLNIVQHYHENNLPDVLSNIRNVSDIEFIYYVGYPIEPQPNWSDYFIKEYKKNKAKADKLGITSSKIAAEMYALLEEYGTIKLTAEQIKKNELKKMLVEVRKYNIPGFFPTPDELIENMINLSNSTDGMSFLEPSAGIGNIADILVSKFPNSIVDCVEQHYSLYKVLEVKGHRAYRNDIFEFDNEIQYDRIIMNPPFEKSEDIDHVRHCMTFLKPGGILVSIMSSGSVRNSNKKSLEFLDYIVEHNGCMYGNGQAFKNAFNPTGVSTVTVILFN